MKTKMKIDSQNAAHSAIKGNSYIVGSVDNYGSVSFSTHPTVHYTAQDARLECKRLSAANPGKTFMYARLMGGEYVEHNPRKVSL